MTGGLSIVRDDSPSAWGTWAARRGLVTLIVDADQRERAIDDLLAQFPWARCVPAARRRLAELATIPVEALDAALDARGARERERWVSDVAGHDPAGLVAAWLVSAIATCPIGDRLQLLDIAVGLAAPVGVLVSHEAPTRDWLARAIDVGAQLAAKMPAHPIGIVAPAAVVDPVLRDGRSSAIAIARQSVVSLDAEPFARSKPERVLYEALAADRRTARAFELNAALGDDEVDLLAREPRVAVEVDGWYWHMRSPDTYRRDRVKDLAMQRAGFLVMRVLAEDVDDRIDYLVDEIAIVLAARRRAP